MSDVDKLRREVEALRNALCTALVWMGQSTNTPLSQLDIKELLRLAHEGKS